MLNTTPLLTQYFSLQEKYEKRYGELTGDNWQSKSRIIVYRLKLF